MSPGKNYVLKKMHFVDLKVLNLIGFTLDDSTVGDISWTSLTACRYMHRFSRKRCRIRKESLDREHLYP